MNFLICYSVNKQMGSALFTYVPQEGSLLPNVSITISDDNFCEIFLFCFVIILFFFLGGGGGGARG